MADFKSKARKAQSVSVTFYGARKETSAQRLMMPSLKHWGASLKRIPVAKFGTMCASKMKNESNGYYTTLNKKE